MDLLLIVANHSDINRLTETLRRYKPNLTLYEEYYKDFHQNPELSRQESRTARIATHFLNDIGSYRVTEKIGGHGVVGIFEKMDLAGKFCSVPTWMRCLYLS